MMGHELAEAASSSPFIGISQNVQANPCRFIRDTKVGPPNKPGDFRSWGSPQTLPALFIGPFEHVERFRNLKFAVKRITNIQSTVLSFSEGTPAFILLLNNV